MGKDLVGDPSFENPVEVEVPLKLISSDSRSKSPHIRPERRRRTFKEVESALTIEDAVREAKRCLRCGPCHECRHCLSS